MKRTYHFCISGGDELICRTDPDYYRAFNCLALAANETESSILAEAIMSNHIHVCARSATIEDMINRFRYSYSRYFNRKYGRYGRLGENNSFISEIDGFHHLVAALCYVLRNAVHHGVSTSAFAYKHCSANALFMKERGVDPQKVIIPQKSYYRFIPRSASCPQRYKMNPDGVFLRESVLDIADVEHHFGSVRSFLFYMNRLSGEEWTKEQAKDQNNKQYITLATIEQHCNPLSINSMFHNEYGRNILSINDIELCSIIDYKFLTRLGSKSIYTLSVSEKQQLLDMIRAEHFCSEKQLRRCLNLE